MYQIILSKKAAEQKKQLKAVKLDEKAKALLNIIAEDPFKNPPPYEKLFGDLRGLYSRRINHKHRLVYEVLENEQAIHVLSVWTHSET
ncbi:MAG: Txe/YoeB family addiction module toxin [Clostridia bacterium]|nr:Txe/YoeB family addiction module toxin [Clostridia bacterium]